MTRPRSAAHADHTLLSIRDPRRRHELRESRRKDDPAMFSQDFAVIRAVHADRLKRDLDSVAFARFSRHAGHSVRRSVGRSIARLGARIAADPTLELVRSR
jgi:hypothetical protein